MHIQTRNVPAILVNMATHCSSPPPAELQYGKHAESKVLSFKL